MPFKPNYGAKRADRGRAQKARHEEKMKERQERSEKRKAERDLEAPETAKSDESAE